MATATVKLKMFNLPNFLRIEGQIAEGGLDVAELFPDDLAAADFWDSCSKEWVEHVAKRRRNLTEP
jgi:hypothetical protein